LLFAFCFALTHPSHAWTRDGRSRSTAQRFSLWMSRHSRPTVRFVVVLLFCSFALLLVCSFARLLVCSFARLLSIDYRVEGQLDGLSLLLLLLVAPLPHLRISFWWPAASPLHGPRRNRRLALVLLSNLAELPRALGMLLAD
jgi:hypothetical protein